MTEGQRNRDSKYRRIQNLARRKLKAAGAGCSLCGRPIDYSLAYPDPLSFVVDHVVPLSRGGSHDMGNLRASHRWCNSKKSDRLTGGPVLRRSGSLAR